MLLHYAIYKPKQRVEILKKIYKSLNWGVRFIMFEGKSSKMLDFKI